MGGKKLKLFKIFILATLLFTSVGSATASTSSIGSLKKEKDEQIIYESKEIKDLDLLRERALKGVTDEKETKFKNNVVLQQDGDKKMSKTEELTVKTYETTQKLKSVKKGDGTLQESMVTTVFVDIPKEPMGEVDSNEESEVNNDKESEKLSFISPIYKFVSNFFTGDKVLAASQYDDETGSSYTVRSYSTIYWDRKTSGGLNYVRLTRVSGGWTLLDSTFTLSNRRVEYGQTPLTNVSETKYPTGNIFNYYTPTSWGWENDGSSVAMGATTYVTVKRGTNSFIQAFTNNYY